MNMPAHEDRGPIVNKHSAAGTIDQLYEPVSNELQQVRDLIAEQLQSSEAAVNTCTHQLAQRRGKMLRPALTLLCGRLLSSLHSKHLEFAAMTELIHMASLLHDDVIDGSDLRRGEPSMNALWGNTAAVLLGDFLLAKAFALGTGSGNQQVMDKIIQTAQSLCEGELTQNLCKDHFDVTETDYLKIIEKKTATLFSCCCGLGALASGASEERTQLLENFGRNLGLAFQISDDLKDLLSNKEIEGKPLRKDIFNGIFTLPVIHWISQKPMNQQQFIEYTKSGYGEDLVRLLKSSGSIQYTVEKAKMFLNDAKDALESFPDSREKDALLSIAENIIFSEN